MKIILGLLIVEIALIFIFGTLTYSNGACITNNNWYWTTDTDPGAVVNCPNLALDNGPASKASVFEFDTLNALFIILPITALGGLVILYQNRKKK